jgi:hypothetical protein
MAATAARGQTAVKSPAVLERDDEQPQVEVRPPTLGGARDVAVVSAIAITQLVWMAALAYALLWLLM